MSPSFLAIGVANFFVSNCSHIYAHVRQIWLRFDGRVEGFSGRHTHTQRDAAALYST